MTTLSHNQWKQHRKGILQARRISRISNLLANADIIKVQRKKRKKRLYLFERQNHRCAYCFKQVPLTIDHVISLRMGGLDGEENMVGACVKCNGVKSTIDGYTFYLMLHPDKGLAEKLKNLMSQQPWIRKYLKEVVKYAQSLHLINYEFTR